MTTIRYVTDDNGETLRTFTLVGKVSFRHDPGEDGPQNYFLDSELIGLAKDWAATEFEYHEDIPRIEFTDQPVRDIWEWIIGANDGLGADTDDLREIMDRHGLTCPEDLADE